MHFTVMVVGDDIEQQLAPFQENNMGDCPEEYLEEVEYEGETYKENPNAQWDWYLLGGRWTGLIQLKPEAKSGKTGETPLIMGDKKPGIDQAKKGDILNWDTLSTFAILRNGEWDEYSAEAKNNIPDNELISIVDCHI